MGLGEQIASTIASSEKLLTQIYQDSAQPGVQQVGKAIGTVLGLGNTALLPLKLLNEKTNLLFEKHMQDYRQRLAPIPLEKICALPPEIGVPILDRLTYVSNQNIADMFINLLAKASSEDTVGQAHPGFISILERLSSDEANIVSYLRGKFYIPYSNINVKAEGEQGSLDYASYLSELVEVEGLNFPGNIVAYTSNLIGIGILSDSGPGNNLVDREGYEAIYQLYNKYRADAQTLDGKTNTVRWDDRYLAVTRYGELFIKICTNGG